MKKVLKSDLVDLIAQFYHDFVRPLPLSDIADGEHGVNIVVNSICIYVTDHNMFDSKSGIEDCMREFAKHIKAITFGNLEVTRMGSKTVNNSCLSWMCIANAYEFM